MRKKDLLMIQFNDHDIINLNLNELNLVFTLSFRDVEDLESFKDLKVYIMR